MNVPGMSRRISIYLLCAIVVREGGKCLWCLDVLTYENKSIDHFDGNTRNNSPDNLFAACILCNGARGQGTEAEWTEVEFRVRAKGKSVSAIVPRFHRHAERAISARSDRRVVALAKKWYGKRLAYCRAAAQERRKRRLA